MFCKNCGKEINDNAAVCIHCGCAIEEKPQSKPEFKEDKKGMGALLGFFLGIIGLIIGICIYPAETNARKTFIKGWAICFGIVAGISILLSIILVAAGTCALGYYY